MKAQELLTNPQYDPNRFLGWLIWTLKTPSDSMLARRLGVRKEIISKIRHKKNIIGDPFLLRVLDATDMHIRDVRPYMFAVVH